LVAVVVVVVVVVVFVVPPPDDSLLPHPVSTTPAKRLTSTNRTYILFIVGVTLTRS